MNRRLRSAHFLVWLVLDAALIAVIALGFLARPAPSPVPLAPSVLEQP